MLYSCKIGFFLYGLEVWMMEIILQLKPLHKFTHQYSVGKQFDEKQIQQSNALFVQIKEIEQYQRVLSLKKEKTKAVFLVSRELAEELYQLELAPEVEIWVLPTTKSEFRYHLKQWQNKYKLEMDLWQTQNYLDTTINGMSALIWYKDKDGVHKKVNTSFCKAVNKDMEQIEGRGHYYIWDIAPEEYAKGEYICMESEYEVMNKKETCVFDETVMIGDELHQLETYKSPLFDVDGNVMGTVGVAWDVTQKKIYEQQMFENANTDFLTGLYNRRHLYSYLNEIFDKECFTAYYLDLDRFKMINDTYGHKEGDRALMLTTDVLLQEMPEALIARIGGDEFMLIECGEATMESIQEKKVFLEKRLKEAYCKVPTLVELSASIGVIYSKPGDELSIDKIIAQADENMYKEKKYKR